MSTNKINLTDEQKKRLKNNGCEQARDSQKGGDRRSQQNPGSGDWMPPSRHDTTIPGEPLALINRQRQEAESEVAREIATSYQAAEQSVDALQNSAHISAQQLGYKQFLVVAGFRGLVGAYTSQFINEYRQLEEMAQNGFQSPSDFNEWTERMTKLSFPAITPVSQQSALPETKPETATGDTA